MAQFCAFCGAQLPSTGAFCPACGRAAGSAEAYTTGPAAPQAEGGLSDNIAGALAYVTIIPAIVFLLMEPYNRRPFPRFHSYQSIFFFVACMAASMILSAIGVIPGLGWLLLPLWPVLGLAEIAIWVILILKANSGQMFKLPVIGDLAEKQAMQSV